jgi:molybdopterin-guanine dinucleotide biosynthesis protein A
MSDTGAKRPFYGLVLAGGESRRMGRDKALLLRDGESLLAYVVRLLEAHTDKVFVSARAEQSDESQRRQFPQIVDRYRDLGPVAGILSAMDEYPGVDWLVVACDLPNIDAQTISELSEHRHAANPFVAYRSSYDELPEPLCSLYLGGSEAILRRFVAEGLKCPRKMLIRSDTLLLTQPTPESLDNINTPAELRDSVLEAAR